MADDHGHIKLSRKFFRSDPFWQRDREYSRAEAWIDLIQEATWKRRREKTVNGCVVTLHRGQLLASERYLAGRWNWSRGKVRRYLGTLADMDRAKVQKDHEAAHLGARITLCNYDSYQSPYADDGPETDHRRTTGGPKRRQGKARKEERDTTVGSLQEPPSVSPKKVTWPKPSDLPKKSGNHDYPEPFEDIWEAYPRHRGKKTAYRKVRAWVNDGEDPETLLRAAEAYAERMAREGRDKSHIKHASTFFGPDDHWREELQIAEQEFEDPEVPTEEEFSRWYGNGG